MYDAVQRTVEVEEAASRLTETLDRVEVTEEFSEVLGNKQIDEVYCSALALSAAITEYLTIAIMYLEVDHFRKNLLGYV